MATRRIQEFLDGNHVHYALIRHSPAYSAAEVAESVHISSRNLAKVVVIAIADKLALAVVPANHEVDLSLIQRETGVNNVRLAKEDEFCGRFEGCQLGTAPPFGNLFGMDTYAERSLMEQTYIAFNAGTHRDVIVMNSGDFVALAHPKMGHIDVEPVREHFAAVNL